MEVFGKFVFGLLIGALGVFSHAYAAVILWRWFVIPLFHSNPLTWNVAYGLILLLGIMHATISPEQKDKSFSAIMARSIAICVIAPWISVLIGWIIK